MKYFILVIFFVLMLLIKVGECAKDYDYVNRFVGKNVLITYKANGINYADIGNILTLIKDEKDHTINKMYSYIVLFNIKRNLKVIKIKDINTIEEFKKEKD